MNFTQVKETCLYVSDLDRSEAFYHGLLGLPLISKVAGRHVFFRVGTSVLLCFRPDVTRHDTSLPPHYGAGKLHLALEVPAADYAATKADFEKKGIEITHEQSWGDGLRSFYFEDPDGHVLEVVPAGIWG